MWLFEMYEHRYTSYTHYAKRDSKYTVLRALHESSNVKLCMSKPLCSAHKIDQTMKQCDAYVTRTICTSITAEGMCEVTKSLKRSRLLSRLYHEPSILTVGSGSRPRRDVCATSDILNEIQIESTCCMYIIEHDHLRCGLQNLLHRQHNTNNEHHSTARSLHKVSAAAAADNKL
eukprot:4526-Heterococcus_DN1.PRE.2